MTDEVDVEQEPQRLPAGNPYRNLQDIEERQRSIVQELGRIDAIDEPSIEDVNWQGTLIQEWNDNEATAKPLRQRNADLKAIAQASRQPENREPATGAAGGEGGSRRSADLHTRTSSDPLDNLDAVRKKLVPAEELRSRAMRLVDSDHNKYGLSDEYADASSRRAHDSHAIARHILLTGSQEYQDAFRAYLEDPEENEYHLRALTTTPGSGGGFLLPYVLDPTIVLTNNASANPFRRIARVVQTTSNAWQGVNSAGVTAAWITEGATAADNTPNLGQIQLTPAKAAAWVFGSYEALDDTDFGMQLPGLLADARDRLESAAFATGSGTNQPLGIAAALGTGSRVAPAATGTAFSTTAANVDVYNLQAALPPRFRNSSACGWIANLVVINKVRGLDTAGGSSFWANFGSDTPEQLLGKNIYEASDMNAVMTGTSAATGTGSVTLLFGDWNQFIIADRVGVSMLYEPMIKGAAGNNPTGQSGWYMFWRTTSGVATTAAFRYLTIS